MILMSLFLHYREFLVDGVELVQTSAQKSVTTIHILEANLMFYMSNLNLVGNY